MKAKTRARADDVFGAARPKKGVAASKAAAPEVQLGAHGRYQIKSGRLGGEYIARAFARPPVRLRGVVAEARGATEAAAIAALHEALDRRETARTSGRRVDGATGLSVPSADEYAEAIGQVKLSDTQRALLAALALADTAGLTEADMARAAGLKSRASARKSLTVAGAAIARFLAGAPEGEDASPGPEAIDLVAYRGTPRDGSEDGPWILHPELRAAVAAMRA